LDHPLHKKDKNQDGKTARQVFTEEHKPLLEEGKKWIKGRSNTCMIVAALIATVTFAAAITVSGSNIQDKAIPVAVFILSDVVAFFCSMASLLVFLANTNKRFTNEEFMMVFTRTLVSSLDLLFVAVVTTTIAFIAAMSMILEERFTSAVYIFLLATLPIFFIFKALIS
jgi:hypothetical protein